MNSLAVFVPSINRSFEPVSVYNCRLLSVDIDSDTSIGLFCQIQVLIALIPTECKGKVVSLYPQKWYETIASHDLRDIAKVLSFLGNWYWLCTGEDEDKLRLWRLGQQAGVVHVVTIPVVIWTVKDKLQLFWVRISLFINLWSVLKHLFSGLAWLDQHHHPNDSLRTGFIDITQAKCRVASWHFIRCLEVELEERVGGDRDQCYQYK